MYTGLHMTREEDNWIWALMHHMQVKGMHDILLYIYKEDTFKNFIE